MGRIDDRLRELDVTLPMLPVPIANYVPAKQVGNVVYTAGQVSAVGGREWKGKLGDAVDVEEGKAATRACVINCLAAIRAVVGSLDRVRQVVAVHGLVSSTPSCTDQAQAMNGASDLVVQIFGDAGKHVRTAVGVAALPLDFTASVHMIVEVE